jgi:hypothetical protein
MATIIALNGILEASGVKFSIHNSSKAGINPFHFLTEIFILRYFRRHGTEQNYIRETMANGGNDSYRGFRFTLFCLVGWYQCCGGTYCFSLRGRSEPRRKP